MRSNRFWWIALCVLAGSVNCGATAGVIHKGATCAVTSDVAITGAGAIDASMCAQN